MSNRPTADFATILSDSGIPTTSDELETELKEQVIAAGSNISNDSTMSPFWSWVRAAVITPVLWLINTLLAEYILPNMFVATAERWALELKAWELDITPTEAIKVQGYITFTKSSSDDVTTVVAGSIVQTSSIDSVVYQLQVLEDTVIAAGEETGQVLVEALEAGEAYNLSAGYYNILPVELSGISSAVNETDWISTFGADAESDEDLALRLQNAFTSSGNWHIDDAYRTIITSVASISSDNIFFKNTGDVTPGTATAYILKDVGETSQTVLDELNQHIQDDGYHGHGDVLTCSAIPDCEYDLSVDVVLTDNLTDTQTTAALTEVDNRIRAAFRETAAYATMTRSEPSSRFSMSNMTSEIHNNMSTVESIKVTVNDEVQEDIVSSLEQPRISSLSVQEVS